MPSTKPAPYAALLPLSLLADPYDFHPSIREPVTESHRDLLEFSAAHTILERGAKLQPSESEQLKHILRTFAGDIWLHSHLVGYYLLRDRKSAHRASALEHILWIIENSGETYLAVTTAWLCISPQALIDWRRGWSCTVKYNGLMRDPDLEGGLLSEYLDPIKESWSRALAARPGDTRVMGRAAEFFLRFDRVTTGRLLRDARKLEPDNPRWTELIAGLYQREFRDRQDESRPDWAAMALAEWEHALSQCSDTHRGCQILFNAATCAFEAHEFEKASALAQKLVDQPDDSWTGEHARHSGHQLLGRIELRSGNVEQAKYHLFASIDFERTAPLAIMGPRLELARELHDHGETKAVLKYLKECARLRRAQSAQLAYARILGDREHDYARLADQLERGEKPDFDCGN
jgi:hypothetical protein